MKNKKTIIIAEACQNHNGDKDVLKKMIYTAKEAGANYIKIQSINSEELTYRRKFEDGLVEAGKAKVIKRPFKSEFERLKKLDLSEEDHVWFVEECKKVGIKPLTTIFTFSMLDFLSALDWDAVKIASYDCASKPLLSALKDKFKHLIVSTGSTYDNEIAETAELLKDNSYSFLHCVTIYPTPLSEVYLRRIDWLRKFTSSVGYSDHTLVEKDGIKASLSAIYYGADIIERHYTVLKKDQTKDGPISINPKQLKQLVEFAKLPKEEQKQYIKENIPEYDKLLGSPKTNLSHDEELNREYYRGRFAVKKNNHYHFNWEE